MNSSFWQVQISLETVGTWCGNFKIPSLTPNISLQPSSPAAATLKKLSKANDPDVIELDDDEEEIDDEMKESNVSFNDGLKISNKSIVFLFFLRRWSRLARSERHPPKRRKVHQSGSKKRRQKMTVRHQKVQSRRLTVMTRA